MDSKLIELPNGIRVSYLPVPGSKVVHCGWVLKIGTRSEKSSQRGIAHFLEHMLFKGTSTRSAFEILNYLETVGGDIDAYTSREKTCVYASIPADYAERAVEFLTDILMNSTFSEEEIVKEKGVISEEIDMYRDNPEEAILEDFDDMVFPNHQLGYPILGFKDEIKTFKSSDFKSFLGTQLQGEKMIFSIAGDLNKERLGKIICTFFEPLSFQSGENLWNAPPIYTPNQLTKTVEGVQAHMIIGNRALGIKEKDFFPFHFLNYMLGGPANNSILNLNIREKYGLAYNLYSFYNSYQETGLWGIYVGCEKQNLERIQELVMAELKSLQTKGFSQTKLDQLKRQLSGQMVMGYENYSGRMLGSAKNHLDFGKDYSLAETISEVNSVTLASIISVAEQVFDPAKLSMLTYLPS